MSIKQAFELWRRFAVGAFNRSYTLNKRHESADKSTINVRCLLKDVQMADSVW